MSVVKISFPENSKKSIFVTWTLHNFCNYRCSYCPPGCHAATKRPYDHRDVISFSERVVSQARELGYDSYTIAFSGGEPTLFPQFEEVLKTLYSQGVDVTFTSNGSRPLSFWQSVVDHFNHCVWSYHPETAKPDEFLEKAKFVTQHCWLNVDFMMTPEHFLQNIELGKKLSELPNIRVDYLPIQKEFGGQSEGLIDYSEDQLHFLQNRPISTTGLSGRAEEKIKRFKVFGRGPKVVTHLNDKSLVIENLDYKSLIASDQNKFKGWSCFAGVESLIVNLDGSVYRAYCYEGGQIGNIWDTLSIPNKPVICTQERCKCSVDIEVSKFDRGQFESI